MFAAILFFIQIIVLAYLGWAAFYQFFFAAAGMFYRARRTNEKTDRYRRIAVFVPAYREDAVIVSTVKAALEQDYPADRFAVIVAADQLQPATLATLREMPVAVLEVQFEKSTKSKALNRALAAVREIGRNMNHHQAIAAVGNEGTGSPLAFAGRSRVFSAPEIAVVLDADNVMAPGFLQQINRRFAEGARVLQGRRAAKNMHTGMAMLDAAGEDANNHILCRGHRALGFSARLAGSGMAFEFDAFEQAMAGIDVVGGFDKALEFHFIKAGVSIEYDERAVVLDEKVSATGSFARQRSRWIAAQFQFAAWHLPQLPSAVLRGRFDYADKTLQMALPPRLLLPGMLAFALSLSLLSGASLSWAWLAALALNVGAFALALPRYVYASKNLKLWLELPAAFGATFQALGRMKEARERFIVTPKTVTVTVN